MAKFSPEELFRQGKHQEAIPGLKKKVEQDGRRGAPAQDMHLRMLGQSLLATQAFEEAAAAFQRIEKKEAPDYEGLYLAYTQLGQPERAFLFDRVEPLLSLAAFIQQGRPLSDLSPDSQEFKHLRILLEKTAALDGCPVQVYHQLDQLYQKASLNEPAPPPAKSREATQPLNSPLRRRIDNLKRCLQKFPDDETSQAILLSLAEWSKDRALVKWLLKLYPPGNEPVAALWMACRFEWEAKNYSRALEALNAIPESQLAPGVHAKLSGDLALDARQPAGAARMYTRALQARAGQAGPLTILLRFDQAWAEKLAGEDQKAVQSLTQAVQSWFDEILPGRLFRLEPPIWTAAGQSFRPPSGLDSLQNSLNWALTDGRAEFSAELQGLCYFLSFAQSEAEPSPAPANPADGPNAAQMPETLVRALQLNGHPRVALAAGEFLASGSPSAWLESLDYLLRGWIWAAGQGFDPQPEFHVPPGFTLLDSDRLRLHQTLAAALDDHRKNERAVQAVFLPLYHQFWAGLLLEGCFGEELVAVSQTLLSFAAQDVILLRNRVIGLDLAGQAAEAVEAEVLHFLRDHPDDPVMLPYYARFLFNQGHILPAFEWAKRALANENTPENQALADKIQAHLGEKAEVEQILQKSIRERWGYLQAAEKELLAVLLRTGFFDNFEHLADYVGLPLAQVQASFEKYLDWRLIGPAEANEREEERLFWIQEDRYFVYREAILLALSSKPPTVLNVTRRERASGDFAPAIRSPFHSRQEYEIYQALEGIFPPDAYWILPNLALSAIFDPKKMEARLSGRDLHYFRTSPVDLCVVRKSVQQPVVAFEVDSSHHNYQEKIPIDRRKNRIFHTGGLPLLRLWFDENASVEEMRAQIQKGLEGLL